MEFRDILYTRNFGSDEIWDPGLEVDNKKTNFLIGERIFQYFLFKSKNIDQYLNTSFSIGAWFHL